MGYGVSSSNNSSVTGVNVSAGFDEVSIDD